MKVVIQRLPADGECSPGECFVDGVRHSYSVERTSQAPGTETETA